jgi:hypothetical protein
MGGAVPADAAKVLRIVDAGNPQAEQAARTAPSKPRWPDPACSRQLSEGRGPRRRAETNKHCLPRGHRTVHACPILRPATMPVPRLLPRDKQRVVGERKEKCQGVAEVQTGCLLVGPRRDFTATWCVSRGKKWPLSYGPSRVADIVSYCATTLGPGGVSRIERCRCTLTGSGQGTRTDKTADRSKQTRAVPAHQQKQHRQRFTIIPRQRGGGGEGSPKHPRPQCSAAVV